MPIMGGPEDDFFIEGGYPKQEGANFLWREGSDSAV